MAGIFLFLGRPDQARIERAATRLKFFEEQSELTVEPQFSLCWIGHDDAKLFGPAIDPQSGVQVVTSGRVSWEERDWQRAERLSQYKGGLSNRLLLDRYLANGASAVERHNGPAALIIWDPRAGKLQLWTDHFGYHPVFAYRIDDLDRAVVSSFADAIAADSSVDAPRDLAASAEFLSAWRVTPPHTYYRGIDYVGAAVHCTWDLHKRVFTRREYWKPHQSSFFPDIDSAAEELAHAVAGAVKIRTLARLSPVVSYTSGGMDSRAVLFSADQPSAMVGMNLYDVPNNESAISKRLCEAAGVRYFGFQRDDDYYPRTLTQATAISGAMWSHEDNHYLGTRAQVMELGARTVMTACTTDWLFKGYGLEKTYRRFLGRNLPIKVLTPDRVNGFLPNFPRPVPAALREEVASRLEACFAGTPRHFNEDSDWLAVEDRRVRPACYAVSVSGQSMYRTFPYDTFLADVSVADCYSRSRAAWKVNADLWGKTVRRICQGADDIEDANFGWRVGSSTPQKLRVFAAGWIRRRLSPAKVDNSGLATNASWPNYGWYALHSKTLRNLWDCVPADTREHIAAAWGADPWRTPLQDWSSHAHDLFRILTLATHISRSNESSRS